MTKGWGLRTILVDLSKKFFVVMDLGETYYRTYPVTLSNFLPTFLKQQQQLQVNK